MTGAAARRRQALRRPRRSALAMINVAAMVSPRNLPMMAEYGWSLIFFVLLAVVLFLVPVSLAIAELAITWPRRGGVYPWVKEAFKGRAGFLAVWCDWPRTSPGFDRAGLHGRERLRARPRPGNNKVFLVVVMLTGLLGRRPWPPSRASARPAPSERSGPCSGPSAGAPDHGAGVAFLVDDNDSEILFGRRARPEPRRHEPGLPDRRDPDVRRMEVAGFPPTRRATPPAASPGRSCWRP